MHLCQQYKLGIVMEEKDCTAFLFLRSVQINSLHHVSNFPWVVYLLLDNMRLLNTCAQQALVICLCIVALCPLLQAFYIHMCITKYDASIWL